MEVNIKTEVFEGPFDLLFHLIKKSELDIYDIPIALITEQYIDYLNKMAQYNFDIASEFIVMVATLIEIKSKLLLPKVKSEETVEEEDPRKQLVDKLLEYKKYKEFALNMKNFEGNNIIFYKDPEIIDDIEDKEIFFKNITINNIMTAFRKVMEDFKSRKNDKSEISENIAYDEYKIEDEMEYIKNRIMKDKKVLFSLFFEEAKDKMELIVIFLGLLELIKLRVVKIVQLENFGDIYIEGQEKLWII